MDWQHCMNQAMAYIESNLSEKISYQSAAQFIRCSEWEFRRMFSFLVQMPISEYIRKRRLTMAIDDIKMGARLTDVSQKYGYESQAAFSRAFKQMHGATPSQVKSGMTTLKPFQRLTFKLYLKEYDFMENDSKATKRIMGSRNGIYAVSIEDEPKAIHHQNDVFWSERGTESIGVTALPKYGAFLSEETCQFFNDIAGKKVLEIGCGTGESLKYLANKQAGELWGLDLSDSQIEKTRMNLERDHFSAQLYSAPMEVDCGLPKNYFDCVYSIYGIGWSTDLDATFNNIASYLKVGGTFIFSWSHPIHKCVSSEEDQWVFKKNYFDESWYSVPLDGGHFALSDRKMSTYINALAKAGFYIEALIEESEEKIIQKIDTLFAKKASVLPVTFVIKARKINE